MLKNILTVTAALVFLLLHSWQAAAGQKMIEDINFEHSGDGEERIIFKLNGTYIPKIFTLQGKQPRVVFDFQDTSAAKMINNIINTNGELIKRIRVGIHKGENAKTRVVLDLRPNKNINIRQDFDKEKQSLIISVHYASSKKGANNEKTATPPVPEPDKQQEVKEEPTQATASPQPEEKQEHVAQQPETITPEPEQHEEQSEPVIPVAQTKQAPQTEEEVQENPGVPTLTSISFDNTSNRGEMVLFKLNEFHPPIVFGIEEGTPRVVCDFKDTTAAKDIPDRLKISGKYIQKIRIGKDKKENKVRVVLDLTPNYSYDLQQVFFKEENLFVIIINTLGNAPTGDPSELLK